MALLFEIVLLTCDDENPAAAASRTISWWVWPRVAQVWLRWAPGRSSASTSHGDDEAWMRRECAPDLFFRWKTTHYTKFCHYWQVYWQLRLHRKRTPMLGHHMGGNLPYRGFHPGCNRRLDLRLIQWLPSSIRPTHQGTEPYGLNHEGRRAEGSANVRMCGRDEQEKKPTLQPIQFILRLRRNGRA